MRVEAGWVIAIANLVCAVLLLAVCLLIYLPAPTYPLWVLAAFVTEIPLPLALIGVFILGISQLCFSFGKHRLLALSSTLTAALAVSLALTLVQNIYQFSNKAGYKLDPIAAFNFVGNLSFLQNPSRHETYQTVEYARRDGKPLLMDIYNATALGAGKRGRNAGVLVVHGGSWRGGKRSDFAACNYWLAKQGFKVYDIDYRLADGVVHYPAAIEDVRAAIAFIRTNCGGVQGQPARIALLGRSAGAQVVLDAAYLADKCGKPLSQCVVSFYGPTDLAWDYANPVEPDVINARAVLKNYLGGDPGQRAPLYKEASPALNVCAATQPTLIFHGLHDQLVAPYNSLLLDDQLKKQQRSSEICLLPWANHGFDWHFDGFSSQIDRAVLLHFLEKNL